MNATELKAAVAVSSGWGYYDAVKAEEDFLNAPERVAKRSPEEVKAREAGWFPTRHGHVMFKGSNGVCRHLRAGETYNADEDSLMSSPMRHASNWKQACEKDGLK